LILFRAFGKFPFWGLTNFPQRKGAYFESSQIGNFHYILEIQCQSAKLALWRTSGEWAFCPLTTLDGHPSSCQIDNLISFSCSYAIAFTVTAVTFRLKAQPLIFLQQNATAVFL
jgi:hypothetical protein